MAGFDIDLPADMAAEERLAQKSYTPADQLSLANITGESPYLSLLDTDYARGLVGQFLEDAILGKPRTGDTAALPSQPEEALRIGSASFNAFLQANVTGPVLEGAAKSDKLFVTAYEQLAGESKGQAKQGQRSIDMLRKSCLRSLDIDGVSVYSYIPHIELFCFAKWIFTSGQASLAEPGHDEDELARDLAWMRFRVHLWHYKLLSQPSLGPGSLFTKSGRFTDVGTLQELIERSLVDAGQRVFGDKASSGLAKDGKVQFLLEEANAHIMLGNDQKAKEALQKAAETSGFAFALSGALGKRTKFQQDSISQLVVFAKSGDHEQDAEKDSSANAAPSAVPLNDETLLEKVSFTNEKVQDVTDSNLPEALQDLTPQTQPQLKAEDQIILLTEATLKDTFSPVDSLTLEEVLPFAERVLDDKSTNWQIYTQALLVRSRIELNRSRTIERGVLQMQAVVDQVVVDTDAATASAPPAGGTDSDDTNVDNSVPAITVSREDDGPPQVKATSFLPAAKASESASPQVRLRYVNALSSPPRWHLESELAFAWTSVGSLVSALEIFKRLRLWPEVALCLASSAQADDPDGRGSGGEEKARAIVRWRLFHRTGQTPEADDGEDEDIIPDTDTLSARDYSGAERSPPPPNAPRLWCILGDIESEPKHYQRAWEISNHRYGRAQKSLGELYLQQKEYDRAAEAYRLAVGVNRLSPELWGRLGDIELRLGHFPDAAEAFQRAIGASNGEEGGEGARTWSNLGTALLSWYKQIAKENKGLGEKQRKTDDGDSDDDEEEDGGKKDEPDAIDAASVPATARAAELNKPAYKLIQDALTAFKRGATIAQTNWRIWDNVVTLAASLSPAPALDDVVLGTRNVLRIRNSEDALDAEVLALLVREATKDAPLNAGEGIYVAPRGSLQNKVVALVEDEVVPLITTNSEVWSVVSRLRAWRRDYAGAVEAAEKGWRAAIGSTTLSSLAVAAASSSGGGRANGNWQSGEDKDAWETVVSRTSDLVAAYENWGSRVESIGEQRWKGKARSAVRSVMGKGKEMWEGSEGWTTLSSLMEDLRA